MLEVLEEGLRTMGTVTSDVTRLLQTSPHATGPAGQRGSSLSGASSVPRLRSDDAAGDAAEPEPPTEIENSAGVLICDCSRSDIDSDRRRFDEACAALSRAAIHTA